MDDGITGYARMDGEDHEGGGYVSGMGEYDDRKAGLGLLAEAAESRARQTVDHTAEKTSVVVSQPITPRVPHSFVSTSAMLASRIQPGPYQWFSDDSSPRPAPPRLATRPEPYPAQRPDTVPPGIAYESSTQRLFQPTTPGPADRGRGLGSASHVVEGQPDGATSASDGPSRGVADLRRQAQARV